MISGANNLYNKRAEVDELNVFPVPDGDTGTNMSMTVTAVAAGLGKLDELTVSAAADKVSFSALRGARGNSGVILSQFFRGISKALKGKSECSAEEFAEALKKGADAAYKAVMNPTEGTILTVAREVAEGAVSMAKRSDDVCEVLEYAVMCGNKTLEKTPEMLPALKQAGVVDAGGQGWMYFLEGALEALKTGEAVKSELKESAPAPEKNRAQKSIDTGSIKYKYCTEFIVEKKNAKVNVPMFKKAIETKGDSMLVIDDDEIVKVHIHTNNPGFVLEKAVLLGDMINIKIDNMKHQHQSLIDGDTKEETAKIPQENKPFGFVSVCSGDGMSEILKNLGTDFVIEGGQTMNPSTDDILAAAEKVYADVIYVFPNNKNIIMAAEQAAKISEKNIVVIPSKTVPQCISAMMNFNGEKTAEQNEAAMKKALASVKTGQITYAVRDTEIEDKIIKEGDILGIAEGGIEAVCEKPQDACKELMNTLIDDDTEFVTLYYGNDVSQEDAETLCEELEEEYPDVEFDAKYGGQILYYYIISAE